MLTDGYYRTTTSIQKSTVARVAELWSLLSIGDPAGDYWQGGVGEAIAQTVSAGQYAAANTAGLYVDQAVTDQGVPIGEYAVDARAFSGVSETGGSLKSAMFRVVQALLADLAAGRPRLEAQLSAKARATLFGGNEVANAARAAESAGITGTSHVTGYIRELNLPSCDRCIILAGRWYRWSAGFQRHPRCDCFHIPAVDAQQGADFSPHEYFDSLSAAEQDNIFGKANAEAIRMGADMGRVVNANQSTLPVGVYKERVRGADGEFRWVNTDRVRYRGTPTTLGVGNILELAAGDRARAVALLEEHGFIVLRDRQGGIINRFVSAQENVTYNATR